MGDYVDISILDVDERECVIETIYPRDNELIRPKVVNVHQVVIVFALKEPKLNYDLLDRFIILAEEINLEIILCLNKIDLAKQKDIDEFCEVYGKLYKVIETSTILESGLETLKNELKDKTTVFAGPSGVGKSSIVNKLLKKELMETGIVSKKIGRGKHTTRHSEFITFENGYIVDTPGFTSLDIQHIDVNDLKLYYKEFREFNGLCKFQDCVHINEPSCAVKDEVGNIINVKRYDSYKYYYEGRLC